MKIEKMPSVKAVLKMEVAVLRELAGEVAANNCNMKQCNIILATVITPEERQLIMHYCDRCDAD